MPENYHPKVCTILTYIFALVYNNTNEPRIILFLDIEYPIKYLKSFTKILLNNAKIISFVKGINDKSEEIKELFTNNLIYY